VLPIVLPTRAAALLLASLAGSLALAPFQCARDPDPERAIAEEPGDALYRLAEQFREKGNKDARVATLRFLMVRYPSSRFAERARQELVELGEKVPEDAGRP